MNSIHVFIQYIVFMIIHMREFIHRLSYNIRRTYRTCRTVCGVQCTSYSMWRTMYVVQYVAFNIRRTYRTCHIVCGVQCTSYNMWRKMYVVQYVAYNVRRTFWYDINILHWTLYGMIWNQQLIFGLHNGL